MPKINQEIESFARIMVVGIGGSGKNAINHMINSKVKGVSFICMNTDTQDLHHSLAEKKIHIGKNLTKGLGAGMDHILVVAAVEAVAQAVEQAGFAAPVPSGYQTNRRQVKFVDAGEPGHVRDRHVLQPQS